DLFARYLQRRTTAHEAGFAGTEGAAEVMPFEAVPVQPIDARLAWTESLAVMGFFRAGTDMRSLPVPADWPDLVATQEPATAMALALGNFPQALRSLNPLLQTAALASLQPAPTSARSLPALITWASQQKEFPRVLLALGVLRLGKQFDGADEL